MGELADSVLDGWLENIIARENSILTSLCTILQDNSVMTPGSICSALELCDKLIQILRELEMGVQPRFRWYKKVKCLIQRSLNVIEGMVNCLEMIIQNLHKEQEEENNSNRRFVD